MTGQQRFTLIIETDWHLDDREVHNVLAGLADDFRESFNVPVIAYFAPERNP